MYDTNRIVTIDSIRGLLIIAVLFVNDLLPQLILPDPVSGTAGLNSFNAAGWMLPAFLFIMGVTIPYSVNKRIAEGENTKTIARHIIIRTISLLAIGMIMVNSSRVNPEFTGLGKDLWASIMYFAVFLVWNKYQENDRNFFTIAGLKLAGMAIMVVLVFLFRSGEFQNNGSLITGWWGFPGILGWGYLVAALLYLLIRENLLNLVIASVFFLLMAILTRFGFLYALDPLKPVFGVITEGSVPFIVILGIITTITLERLAKPGVIKIPGLPPIIRIIGADSLTVYILSVTIYHLILATGIPVLFYKQYDSLLVTTSGSVAWTAAIMILAKLFIKKGIRLKL